MPVSVFTTYNSNQRVVAVPISPMSTRQGFATGAGTTTLQSVALTTNNTTNAVIPLYVHWFALYGMKTAAASGLDLTLQWQFFNAVPAAVGAAIVVMVGSAGWNGAAAAGVANNVQFFPAIPWRNSAALPGGGVTVSLQLVGANVAGAPNISYSVGYGVDGVNSSASGDIGGSGLLAQTATNPATL